MEITHKQVKKHQHFNNIPKFVDAYKSLKFKLKRDKYLDTLGYNGTNKFTVNYQNVDFTVKIECDYDNYYYDDSSHLGELVADTDNRYAVKSKYNSEYYIAYQLNDFDYYGYTYKIVDELKAYYSLQGYSKNNCELLVRQYFKDEYQLFLDSKSNFHYFVKVTIFYENVELDYDCISFESNEYDVDDEMLTVLYDYDLIDNALKTSYKQLTSLANKLSNLVA